MRIVVFSGAGMSAESGIQTFRDGDGLWANFSIEEVATPEAWQQNPTRVQSFYNERRKQIINAQPNEAHIAIRKLEEKAEVLVVTQNIDDLHERAGSTNVMHLHGNIRFAKSSGPNPEKKYYPIEGWELTQNDLCDDGYPLRPHVVWFGEAVPMLELAAEEISKADVLIVIGTSLQVYPAASLVHLAPLSSSKYLIDPKAKRLTVPSDFHVLQMTASDGMQFLLENLPILLEG
jgi:NAD-dependent deacetylase